MLQELLFQQVYSFIVSGAKAVRNKPGDCIRLIIERYIHREILQRLLWIAGLLILILATHKFVEYLGDAAAGKIPPAYVFKFLWLKTLSAQPEVLPLVIFLAVVLAYARLNQDNELAIMAAAGMGKREQIRITLRFSLVFSVLLAAVSFVAAPWAKLNIDILKAQAWKESSISGLSEGNFKELDRGRSVVYMESYSKEAGVMENVFLQIQDNDKNTVMKSATAYFDVENETGDRYIVFENGRRYLGKPGEANYQITQYEKYSALIEQSEKASEFTSPESASTATLLYSSLPEHRAELQWRISAVLAGILLAVFGVLLNQYPFGQKPFTLLLSGILIYFIYNNLLSISRALLERNNLSSWIGLWWVHILLIAVIAVIYHYSWLMRRIRQHRQKVIVTET